MVMAYVEQPLYNSLSAQLIFILDCPLVSSISIEFEKFKVPSPSSVLLRFCRNFENIKIFHMYSTGIILVIQINRFRF